MLSVRFEPITSIPSEPMMPSSGIVTVYGAIIVSPKPCGSHPTTSMPQYSGC